MRTRRKSPPLNFPRRSPPLPPIDYHMLIEQIPTRPHDKSKHYEFTILPNTNWPNNERELSNELCQIAFGDKRKIRDIWLPNRYRVATFTVDKTATNKVLIEHFVFQCNSNQLKSVGRIVRAYYSYQHNTKSYKVFVLNINLCIDHKRFKLWVYLSISSLCKSLKVESWMAAKTGAIKQLNATILCIVEFDELMEAKQIKTKTITFRGVSFKFDKWYPDRAHSVTRYQDVFDEKQSAEDEMYKSKLETLARQLHQQRIQFAAQINKYQQLNSSMASQNYQLKNENAQIQWRYNNLLVKFAKLKHEKVNEGTYDNYFGWATDDVLVWIFNLENGRYLKYKDILIPLAYAQGLNGQCLHGVTLGCLFKLGIKNMMDIQSLFYQIQKLILSVDKQPVPVQFSNEGH